MTIEDEHTSDSAILEASRLNTLAIEKLVKRQGITNKLLLALAFTIPAVAWADNRGFLTIFLQKYRPHLFIALFFLLTTGTIIFLYQENKEN